MPRGRLMWFSESTKLYVERSLSFFVFSFVRGFGNTPGLAQRQHGCLLCRVVLDR